MQVNTTISGFLTGYDDEAITVSTLAVVGVTASKYAPKGDMATRDMGDARLILITVEGKVRYRLKSSTSDPTATSGGGHILYDGDTLVLSSMAQFKAFKVIRHEGEVTDAKLFVTYFR